MPSNEAMKAASTLYSWALHGHTAGDPSVPLIQRYGNIIDSAADEKYKPLVEEVLQAINGEFEPELMREALAKVRSK